MPTKLDLLYLVLCGMNMGIALTLAFHHDGSDMYWSVVGLILWAIVAWVNVRKMYRQIHDR